jgi:hypothetical protein
VSGHIPNLLGTWGLSTISLGKSVSQERQAKERKFVWVGTTILVSQVLCMRARREKETELEVDAAMEGNSRASWSVIGANWSWKTEEPGCQA